jgi:hypothetical protein
VNLYQLQEIPFGTKYLNPVTKSELLKTFKEWLQQHKSLEYSQWAYVKMKKVTSIHLFFIPDKVQTKTLKHLKSLLKDVQSETDLTVGQLSLIARIQKIDLMVQPLGSYKTSLLMKKLIDKL